jgi:3-dehydroquinate synthase
MWSSTEGSPSTAEGVDVVSHFRIQETDFEYAPDGGEGDVFPVRSSPRPYEVEFASAQPLEAVLDSMVASASHPVVLADRRPLEAHLAGAPSVMGAPMFAVHADEEFKSADGAIGVVAFMDSERVSRSSLLVVIGGGIIQDVGAFAACVYKRGVPWAYVPTTMLAQADSCIGAKSGLNFRGAKNLLGVFSAPRRIIIHTGFLSTLPEDDLLSGLGEVFRLSVIGGSDSLERFEERLPEAVAGDTKVLDQLIRSALSIKRAVVEVDEFELDLRRSMNFGHSIGHALEAITNYAIPHGTAVAVGVLVEADISHERSMLSKDERARLLRAGGRIIPERVRSILRAVDLGEILDLLFQDKKVEGKVLKLVVPESIGQIRFIDFALEPESVPILEDSLRRVLAEV